MPSKRDCGSPGIHRQGYDVGTEPAKSCLSLQSYAVIHTQVKTSWIPKVINADQEQLSYIEFTTVIQSRRAQRPTISLRQ